MSDEKKEKTQKLIDLTTQLLDMSEDHERRLQVLENKQIYQPPPSEKIVVEQPVRIVEQQKKAKPKWFKSKGTWLAIAAFIVLCVLIYLFLRKYKLPKIFGMLIGHDLGDWG